MALNGRLNRREARFFPLITVVLFNGPELWRVRAFGEKPDPGTEISEAQDQLGSIFLN